MNEKTTFKGSPSQLLNFGFYILCFLLLFIYGLGLLLFLIRFLKTRYTKFEITDERIIEQIGVFSRTTDETELYRVKDIRLEEPFLLRIFSLSNIIIMTSDKTSPLITIKGVKNEKKITDYLRSKVEKRRDEKGVRETDFE
jgi:uncharacterized membrane protein YdbT with pleckstrin-like domain